MGKSRISIKMRKKVKCVETNLIYNSCTEAAKATGINRSNIAGVAHKRTHHITAGGYHWEWA
jgi:hypothetical protein